MKGKALRKHSLHEKTAASVLLKLFISGNKWCHTTDAPYTYLTKIMHLIIEHMEVWHSVRNTNWCIELTIRQSTPTASRVYIIHHKRVMSLNFQIYIIPNILKFNDTFRRKKTNTRYNHPIYVYKYDIKDLDQMAIWTLSC